LKKKRTLKRKKKERKKERKKKEKENKKGPFYCESNINVST
jgi:hypothetical protein